MPENYVRNTAAEEDPHRRLLVAAVPGAIEEQEANGQRELVSSDVIPARSKGGIPDEEFAALGFVLGDQVDGDPLFRWAELPPGWARQATEHSLWSHIVDQLGEVRFRMFYKAAFYDRRASIHRVGVGPL